MNKVALNKRRLSLLAEIAERADEIKRIDDELQKPITRDYDRYEQPGGLWMIIES